MSGPRADTDIPQGFRASSSKKKRRLIEISLIVLAPFLLLVGGSLFSNYRSNQRLRDVIEFEIGAHGDLLQARAPRVMRAPTPATIRSRAKPTRPM